MQGDYRLDPVKGVPTDHVTRTCCGFLGRLKEASPANSFRQGPGHLCQGLDSPEGHGRVGVVAARMHKVVLTRPVGDRFLVLET